MADKFNKESLNITEEKLTQFKQLFPEVFSEGKVDFERLKLTLGEHTAISNERYVLNWANKSDAFTAIQTPTTKTLYPAVKESVNFDTTQNVFIEGENLEVLKILQKSYFGKIKMIYIDPPYNTGNDNFIYPDKFAETKEEYLKKIKEKDEEGYLLKEGLFRKNSKENGQFHSNWLNMMYPRLFLAKNLLKDDGVIFVSIDDNEVHNLRLLMNEVFGEDNFKAIFPRVTKKGGKSSEATAKNHDYVLMYSKNNSFADIIGIAHNDDGYSNQDEFFEERGFYKLNQTLDYDSLGWVKSLDYPIEIGEHVYYAGGSKEKYEERHSGKHGRADWGWRWSKDLFEFGFSNGFVELKDSGSRPRIYTKTYQNVKIEKVGNKYEIINIDRSKPLSTLEFIENKYSNDNATKVIDGVIGKGIFEYTKPPELISQLAHLINEKDFFVLDFFAGSGTTAQAVMELNKEDGGKRKFICVQLPEKTEETSEAFRAGYKTISEISAERIRRAIKKIETETKADNTMFKAEGKLDLGFKFYKLKESNFKTWRSDMVSTKEDLATTINMFEDALKDGAKETNILCELLLKRGYDLNVPVETAEVDKTKIYIVNNGELVVCLEKLSDKVISKILEIKPQRCLMLDSLFDGKDSLKTNTVLQLQDAEIDLTVV
ncbi:DNA methylase [Elusimicrobium minutum Pei191]|uniref:site-specific DNA-methyltransferase (adenine-specific) n=1 Tax=Elusimicrobium minutum (strain Pei191) TaxID=445932 RepID=B2KB27_ELUMP|nr:site-specific DNA-methyltransferase [Elusimicrobium minutum]ACC97786.1 DNA methylase [Elusimicrobium minutum Pei191]